ncbi:bud site selection protein Rax2p [[Candida] railenensis]|uniref:Bud site selection protein Rax2p n=1 Tax=[Candida] railenensis TaxID=45579 RepID=A0A9P0QQ37_9ASCO|nr:bud site selection protein Rax2p [[Candida] railenensis]
MRLQWLCTLASSLIAVSSADDIDHPDFNFKSLGGELGLLGAFSAISSYKTANQSSFLSLANDNSNTTTSTTKRKRDSSSSSSSSSSNLYLRDLTSNSVDSLAEVNGDLKTLYNLNNGNVLVTGNFSQFTASSSSSSSSNSSIIPPLIFNVTSGETTSIFNSSTLTNGSVTTVLVDDDLIYLGGDFSFNGTFGAAIYNITSAQLYTTPFEGFGSGSAVNTIVKILDSNSDDSSTSGSIVFGGDFDTLGLDDLLVHNVTSPKTNNTNSTNTSLITAEQIISLQKGIFSSTDGDSSTPLNTLICPETSSGWSVEAGVGGEWLVELPNEMKGLVPTKVRLYVPESGDNSVKLFRIYSYPNNGIMNLSYIDPESNVLTYCDAWCPLSKFSDLSKYTESNIDNADSLSYDDTTYIDTSDGAYSTYYDSSTKTKSLGYSSNYQEFAFKDELSIDKVGLTILEWYGDQGTIQGFELYSNSIIVYGDNGLNSPNCDSIDDTSNYSQLSGGNWKSVLNYTTASSSSFDDINYLVTTVDTGSDTDLSVTFYPNISYSGDYQLLITTPGCILDDSCDLRSIVNVTVYDVDDQVLSSQLIYQNNDYDKFDYLYYGHMNGSATSDGQNKIVVKYDEPVISGTDNPWFVIDKVTADIVSLDTYYSSNTTNSTKSSRSSNVSTISINGLFEYSLANFSNFDASLVKNATNTFVGNSSINYLSGKLASGSNITNIIRNGSTLVLSGDFSVNDTANSNLTSNMITLDISGYSNDLNETEISTTLRKRADGSTSSTAFGAEFDSTVNTIMEFNGGFIFIGDFTAYAIAGGAIPQLAPGSSNTSSMNNFALYNATSWYSYGNDKIDSNFNSMVNVTVDDIQYLIFRSDDNSSAVFDNTNGKWISESDDSYNLYDISASLNINSKQQILGSSSSFNVMDLYSVDQATVNSDSNDSFVSFNFTISDSKASGSYILDSLFINSSLSVLSGSFNTSDGIENVLLLNANDNSTTSLEGTVDWNDATVQALYGGSDISYLVLGVNGSISIDGESQSAGVVFYDLDNKNFSSDLKPAELNTSTSTSLDINILAIHDSDSKLLVGGNFATAGSLDCPGLCIYDIINKRWIQPTSNNSISDGSIVTDLKFYTSDSVLIAGNITFAGSSQTFVTYNFESQTFSSAPSSVNSNISQGIEKFILVDDSSKVSGRMLAFGKDFVSAYDGSSWNNIDDSITYSASTKFSDMKLLTLESSNSANNETFFDEDQILMLAGSFELSEYGLVNAALYNGTAWIPYAFTTSNDNSGNLGVINSILVKDNFGFTSSSSLGSSSRFMSKGKVVGISLACAIGSTIFLSLLYLIPYFALFRKSKDDSVASQRIHESDMMGAVNPEDLIHEIDIQKR